MLFVVFVFLDTVSLGSPGCSVFRLAFSSETYLPLHPEFLGLKAYITMPSFIIKKKKLFKKLKMYFKLQSRYLKVFLMD